MLMGTAVTYGEVSISEPRRRPLLACFGGCCCADAFVCELLRGPRGDSTTGWQHATCQCCTIRAVRGSGFGLRVKNLGCWFRACAGSGCLGRLSAPATWSGGGCDEGRKREAGMQAGHRTPTCFCGRPWSARNSRARNSCLASKKV